MTPISKEKRELIIKHKQNKKTESQIAEWLDVSSGSAQDRPLAEAIYKVLEPLTPAADRGIKKYNLFEAVQPVMPSCYLELSFHDNHDDEQWLLANTDTIADGIIKGVCSYFSIDDKPADTLTQRIAKLEDENKLLQIKNFDQKTRLDAITKIAQGG